MASVAATPRKLRSVAKALEKEFPQLGAWEFVPKAKVAEEGEVDPPCSMIRGGSGSAELELLPEGELWRHHYEYFGQVDMSLTPAQVASQVHAAVDNGHCW
jgi:hypothetical protein